MDLVALNWAVLIMTNSPLHLGLLNACRLIPVFLMSVPAGVLADRYDRRKLLFCTQIMLFVLTFVLGYLIQSGAPFWLFASVVTIRSLFQAMETPITNALLPNLVAAHQIQRAIALNVTVLNVSRMVGPAIAGALIGGMDLSTLFYVNGATTLGILFSLRYVRPQTDIASRRKQAKGSLYELLDYLKTHSLVTSLLLMAVVPMLFGFPFTSMMPIFSRDLLGLGAQGYAMLLTVSAMGAIGASLWLSFGTLRQGAGRWLIYSILGFGLSLLLFVHSKGLVTAGIAMFFAGVTSQFYRTMSRITIQQQVPDELRGRIMSIALMDRGFIPIGAILIGAIASSLGAYWAGLVMGLGCFTVVGLVLWRREIWRL